MKNWKVLFLLTLSMMVAGSVGGCTKKVESNSNSLIVENKDNSSDKKNEGTTEKKKNIGLVMKTLTNPFFVEMEKGARKAEKELGINLIVKTGAKETSIEQQISIVEELITAKVDGIVIAPGSSTELIPVLKKAKDAGIKIINVDNRLDKELVKKIGIEDVPYVGVDNEKGGFLAGKYLSDKITKPTKAAIIEGIRGADNAEQRRAGAARAFQGNPNIQVVASETANWKIDEANDVTKKIFNDNPDIGVLFCANDMMALGTIQYLESNKKTGILVGGFDALEEAKNAIKDGKLSVTIDQKPAEQGYVSVKEVMDLINKKPVPMETMVELQAVGVENLK